MAQRMLQIEKVGGLASEGAACGVFSRRVALADGTLGTLAACIFLKSLDGGDLQTVVGDIFEILTKKLEASGGLILEAIRLSEEAVLDYVSGKGIEVNFCETFFFDEACYVGRHGSEVKILIFEDEKSGEISFEFGSGPVGVGQIYLLATDRLLSIFDSTQLSETGLAEVIDGLATVTSAEENQSEMAAVFVKVKEENKEVGEAQDSEEVSREQVLEEEDRLVFLPETGEKSSNFKFKNSLLSLFRTVLGEVAKLKKGDIRAVLRLRRNIVVVALVILLILVVSVGLTIREKGIGEKQAVVAAHLEQASAKYDKAVAIAQLNKSRAREILIEAEREIRLAQEIRSDEQVNSLREKIAAKLKETEEESSVNFEVLSEVSSPITALSTSGKNLLGVGEGKIFEVSNGKVTREIKSGGGLTSVFVYNNMAFILTEEGVLRLDLAKEESKKVIEARGARDIAVFLGNIYLLGGRQIEKYVPTESGYVGPTSYLSQEADFKESSRLAIDGSIWVTSGDKIFKFTRGERQDFEVSGLVGDWAALGRELGAIYTNSDLDDLYVVDRVNSALLVIGKDGVYKRSYQSGEFGRASDFAVSGDGSEVYIAVGSKILKASL